jgi:molybdate transport system substrate-binding protein
VPDPRRFAVVAVAAGVLAACGGATTGPVAGDGATDGVVPGDIVPGDIVVFAAASLSGAFTELGDEFMAAHPDATVTFNFAGSSELARQVLERAPVDVFAPADPDDMAKLTAADATASDPVVFATNTPEIIVAPGNPLGITSVADLADPDLIVVVCAAEVPCGRYATEIFERAGVVVTPDSLERNVNAVVTKVTLGEADAGIAYRTDVLAAGDSAAGVEIPADIAVTAEYPIAVTSEAPNLAAARVFVDFVLSDVGQAVLRRYGFGSP